MDSRYMMTLVVMMMMMWACHVSSIRFDLEGAGNKCFSEDLNVKGLVLANYHVVSENPAKISAKVTSPYGSSLHTQDHVTKGEFAFTATEAGDYTACFWISDATKGTKVTVDLDWKTGIDAKDWDSIAKREKIDGVELELRKLEEAVNDIHGNMLYLRDREEKMRAVNEVTNWRMAWFSITSLFICLAVAGLQIWYLKSFFERKKLL
ncbi:hypothetical protein GOP47_0007599 [Adiantum capillus-veneris]|uniref:GOLD domain-containing protein n=1 Tax=Adiantum capillus-veneris TaxID=13818 RepID=A0A9D4V108_ADICA|nr:hypothetical protein GOP47_0007599 [Adiantum capillus-veneris]